MKYINRCFCLLIGILVLLTTSCKDVWEDHNAQTVSTNNLLELIGKDASLSTFYSYIKKVGYDTILSSSRTYTVWAPTNDALSTLDASITGNDSILKIFVGNHIAYREYPTDKEGDTINIKMVNSKNLKYINGSASFEGAPLVNTNSYCKNGILHTISAPIYPKNNVWEYIQANTDLVMLDSTFMYYYVFFDSENSTKIGVNDDGEPIYDTVWVKKNAFLYSICDISVEDSSYTVFALNDDAFNNEYNKMSPYIKDTNSIKQTTAKTRLDVCKDIVVRGKYASYEAMPDTLVSVSGIKIPKNAIAVQSSYEASNGYVYVVSSFDIPLRCKIPTIKIEGENYLYLYNSSMGAFTYGLIATRYRTWASGGKDIQAYGGTNGHGIPYLSVRYYVSRMYNITYQAYRRTVNDFQSGTFRMKLAFNPDSLANIIDSTSLGTTNRIIRYFVVNGSGSKDYSDIYIGTWDNKQYGSQNVFLCSDCMVVTSSSPNYPIELDYLKFVPVFN
jgi:uncharacterized surface protein with fasciclin (FAS1) repeats